MVHKAAVMRFRSRTFRLFRKGIRGIVRFFFFHFFFRFWKSANTSRTKVGVSARSFVPCFRHKYNVNPTKLTERSVAPPAQHRKRHFSVGSFVTKTRHTAKRQMEQTPATIASAVGWGMMLALLASTGSRLFIVERWCSSKKKVRNGKW